MPGGAPLGDNGDMARRKESENEFAKLNGAYFSLRTTATGSTEYPLETDAAVRSNVMMVSE